MLLQFCFYPLQSSLHRNAHNEVVIKISEGFDEGSVLSDRALIATFLNSIRLQLAEEEIGLILFYTGGGGCLAIDLVLLSHLYSGRTPTREGFPPLRCSHRKRSFDINNLVVSQIICGVNMPLTASFLIFSRKSKSKCEMQIQIFYINECFM